MTDYEIRKLFINPLYKRQIIQKIKLLSTVYDYGFSKSFSTWYNNCSLHEDNLFYPILKKIENKFPYKIQIKEMWGNINYPGSKTTLHNHAERTNAGVVYLKKPKNSGNIIIDGKVIEVKENDILIFDATQMHMTEINKSKFSRIILSFNYILKSY